jgi:hypothetical protein
MFSRGARRDTAEVDSPHVGVAGRDRGSLSPRTPRTLRQFGTTHYLNKVCIGSKVDTPAAVVGSGRAAE